jgi:hypothetical protein
MREAFPNVGLSLDNAILYGGIIEFRTIISDCYR